jgi:hypothetical protein
MEVLPQWGKPAGCVNFLWGPSWKFYHKGGSPQKKPNMFGTEARLLATL